MDLSYRKSVTADNLIFRKRGKDLWEIKNIVHAMADILVDCKT